MLKLIAPISAKPDISREAFIKHCETSHAPLVKKLLPMIAEYRRSFVCRQGEGSLQAPAPGFDVLTELWFEDQAALARIFYEGHPGPRPSGAGRACPLSCGHVHQFAE